MFATRLVSRRSISFGMRSSSTATAPQLYRQMLKEGSKFQDYNLKKFAVRRVQDRFTAGRSAPKEETEKLLEEGVAELEALKRQVVIQNMYHHRTSVMQNV